MLTPDMMRIVREQRLGFVATTDAGGKPCVSPKATFIVVDERTLAFGDVRSPGTTGNLRRNPAIEVNFVDPFVRKGYRFAGTASLIERGTAPFDALIDQFAQYGGTAARIGFIVKITVERARPLSSPAYDDGAQEPKIRRGWTTHFRKLQPGERYEE